MDFDNVAEIIMMMRYPACLGTLSEEELDLAFDSIRTSQIMLDKGCTFGASITACDGPTCPMMPLQPPIPRSHVSSKYGSGGEAGSKCRVSSMVSRFEGLSCEAGSQNPESSLPSSSPRTPPSGRGSWSETTKGFYLKSAQASAKQTNPAIVVEIYVNEFVNVDDEFVRDACGSINDAIQKHILTQRPTTNTRVQFLVSTPCTMYSLPCCSSESN